MTYKSHQESLNTWAVDELLGHFVNYRKLVSREKAGLVPVKDFRLFAVSARYPKKLLSDRSHEEIAPGVFVIKWGERKIRIVVLSQVSREPRNAFWELFSGIPERVEEGARSYRWKVSDLSTVLGRLFEKYRMEGLTMPYTIEDYRRELREEALASISMSEILEHMDKREILEHMDKREILEHMSSEERLSGLSREQILEYLIKLER